MEPHDYRVYYVNIDLLDQYGISVVEYQTFLLAKRPSVTMSEEKRLPFAGYYKGAIYEEGQVAEHRGILETFMYGVVSNFLKYNKLQTEYLRCEDF